MAGRSTLLRAVAEWRKKHGSRSCVTRRARHRAARVAMAAVRRGQARVPRSRSERGGGGGGGARGCVALFCGARRRAATPGGGDTCRHWGGARNAMVRTAREGRRHGRHGRHVRARRSCAAPWRREPSARPADHPGAQKPAADVARTGPRARVVRRRVAKEKITGASRCRGCARQTVPNTSPPRPRRTPRAASPPASARQIERDSYLVTASYCMLRKGGSCGRRAASSFRQRFIGPLAAPAAVTPATLELVDDRAIRCGEARLESEQLDRLSRAARDGARRRSLDHWRARKLLVVGDSRSKRRRIGTGGPTLSSPRTRFRRLGAARHERPRLSGVPSEQRAASPPWAARPTPFWAEAPTTPRHLRRPSSSGRRTRDSPAAAPPRAPPSPPRARRAPPPPLSRHRLAPPSSGRDDPGGAAGGRLGRSASRHRRVTGRRSAGSRAPSGRAELEPPTLPSGTFRPDTTPGISSTASTRERERERERAERERERERERWTHTHTHTRACRPRRPAPSR